MKKILALFILLITCSTYMKANNNDAKYPYVQWTSAVPAANLASVVANLKTAMQGQQTIAGATVHATADSYKTPWGDNLYNQVLSADVSAFTITTSKGGEVNWGIDPTTKKAVQTGGVLPAGVTTISFNGIEIAKYGTNGCFNAVTPVYPQVFNPVLDPDEVAPGKLVGKPLTQPTGINNTIVMGGGQSEMTWSAGYAVYSMGRNDRQNDFVTDAALFKMIQDSKQCCNQQPQQVVPMTTTGFGQSMPGTVVLSQGAAPANVQPQVIVAQQKAPFGQTLGGQMIAHGFGAVLETVGDAIIANNYPMRSTTYVVNNGNTIPVGGPVNGGTTGSNIVLNR